MPRSVAFGNDARNDSMLKMYLELPGFVSASNFMDIGVIASFFAKGKKRGNLVTNYQIIINFPLMKKPCTYITTNTSNKVLYTGTTSGIGGRMVKHKTKQYKNSFSSRYNCDKLVFYRFFPTMLEAIAFEKKLKGGSRAKKIALIDAMNLEWKDLYDELD